MSYDPEDSEQTNVCREFLILSVDLSSLTRYRLFYYLLVLCACIFGVRRRVPSVVDSNRKRTAESAMLLNAALL